MIEILERILLGTGLVAGIVLAAGALFFGVYTLVEICQELVAAWEDFKRNRI